MSNRILKEIISTAILLLGLGALGLFLFVMRFETIEKLFSFFLVGCGIILATVLLIRIRYKKYQSGFNYILSFPYTLFYGIVIAVFPLLMLVVHLLLYFGIAFIIPFLFYNALKHFHFLDFIKEPTKIYLLLTLTVFLLVLLNPLLRKMVYFITSVVFRAEEKMKLYELDKVTEYVLRSEIIRFIIYGLYVIGLLISNYAGFQQIHFYEGNVKIAVLQSFVTFIAFDRAYMLLKDIDFLPSQLLLKLLRSSSNMVSAMEKTAQKLQKTG